MLLLVSGSTDHGIIVPDRRWRSPALICGGSDIVASHGVYLLTL
jgi:hypothetical protein